MARPTTGPAMVKKLEGGVLAKTRLEAILETIAGQATVDAACARAQVNPARFYVIRERALQAAVERLEPRVGGRPRKARPSAEAERVAELEKQVLRLKQELEVAELRAELSLVLPHRQPKKTSTRRTRPTKRSKRSKARSAR